MLTKAASRRLTASPAFLSLLGLLVVAAAGCSGGSDPSGQAPSADGNYVSANGAVQIGTQTATMMVNIGGLNTRAVSQAAGRLHIGVNQFEQLSGEYRPESDGEVFLTSVAGSTAAGPYVFSGTLEGSTITGTLSGGAVGEPGVQVVLAMTSVPIEAVVLLGPWDFTHEVRVGTLLDGIDPCPVPIEFRTIKDSCSDRYQIEIEGNMLPADSCNDDCLPDIDLATGTLDGGTLTLHLPEVDEPTTPDDRLFSVNLPGCSVIWTGRVAVNALTGNAAIVDLVSDCQGSGDGCDPYCTNGRLRSTCAVDYELELSRCDGDCECPK